MGTSFDYKACLIPILSILKQEGVSDGAKVTQVIQIIEQILAEKGNG